MSTDGRAAESSVSDTYTHTHTQKKLNTNKCLVDQDDFPLTLFSGLSQTRQGDITSATV